MAKPIVVRLTHSSYETLGAHSLSGFYAQKLMERGPEQLEREYDEEDPNPNLILEVEQTSMAYRRKHCGPVTVLMPEFAPYLLLENMQEFQKQGVEVTIKVIEVDEPR